VKKNGIGLTMAKHLFPKISEINPRFLKHCEQKRDCYAAIMRIDGPAWDRLAHNDPNISDEIFAKLQTTGPQHSGGSWMCLIAYFRNLAKTGFSDRFLLKNQHFWVMGYYMPDYFHEALFIAGAGVITALSW
jgi:hypothetical protein